MRVFIIAVFLTIIVGAGLWLLYDTGAFSAKVDLASAQVQQYRTDFIASCMPEAEKALTARNVQITDEIRNGIQEYCTCGADTVLKEFEGRPIEDLVKVALDAELQAQVAAIMKSCAKIAELQ